MSADVPGPAADAVDAWLDDEPAARPVRVGDWNLTLRGTHLDDITHRGRRLLSSLRVVVRDHDWRTVPARPVATEVTVEGEHLQVVLEAEHEDLGAHVRWRGVLTVDGDRVVYAVEGRVASAFRRNRIGIVVLHPPEVAGTALRVLHPAGTSTGTAFPVAIAPHQPARDVAGLAWTADGAEASLTFAGDVFETEDQRNWTDASFKTYSTPLDLPFPVPVAPGDRFSQAVELTVSASGAPEAPAAGATAPADRADAGPTRVELAPTGCPVPQLQVGASTAPGDVAGPVPWWTGPVLVELDATGRAWPGVLARARREAGAAPLDVRITAEDPAQLEPVLAALRQGPAAGPTGPVPAVARVAAYDTAGHTTTPALWEHLLRHAGHLPLAGGTSAHFTELNRRHGDLPADLPALTFSSTPQMHDTGRRQLLESLAAQRLTAEQAVAIAGDRPVHVGPVTLRPRFNAVATSPRPPADADVVSEGTGPQHVWRADDPRQAGRGFAAWLIASFQAFSVAGVASITYAETWGPRGFGAADGTAFPAAGPLQQLSELCGWERLGTPLVPGVGIVAARRHGRVVVLLAELTGSTRHLDVAGRLVHLRPWGTTRCEGTSTPPGTTLDGGPCAVLPGLA
ncbi:hypothetical protein [Kineococcus auxinigenes]|uniref:hypothetical protein n=1 Tax=unclassified Kineococcus TaxID=2621656 RepID=UPI003D7CF57C